MMNNVLHVQFGQDKTTNSGLVLPGRVLVKPGEQGLNATQIQISRTYDLVAGLLTEDLFEGKPAEEQIALADQALSALDAAVRLVPQLKTKLNKDPAEDGILDLQA